MGPSKQAAGNQQTFQLFGHLCRGQSIGFSPWQYSNHPSLLNPQKVRHQRRPQNPFQTISFHTVAEANRHTDRKAQLVRFSGNIDQLNIFRALPDSRPEKTGKLTAICEYVPFVFRDQPPPITYDVWSWKQSGAHGLFCVGWQEPCVRWTLPYGPEIRVYANEKYCRVEKYVS